MDDLVKLRLQEQLLLQELELVKSKIKYVGLCQEAELKKVTSQPSAAETCQKSEASPEQTATGKDVTNPLQAAALPKSKTEVQTSTTLVKPSDLNLRPNGGIQVPKKPEGQTSAGSQGYLGPKAYYVVFNGPNPGIYTTWEIAEKATKGVSGIKHKSYKSFEAAQVAARIYTNALYKPPLELICHSSALRPSYSEALTTKASPKVRLGKIPKQKGLLLENSTEDVLETTYSRFSHLYRIGRNATEKDFAEEHFFTTDKKNISYFNFYPGSCPEMVYEAYQFGLLSMVYPSSNLLEISKFPDEFRKAVKNFRTKVLKSSEKKIFIKMTNTLIYWDHQDEPFQPYHYVQMGVVKDQVYSPSQALETTLEKSDLLNIAEQKLLVLINKLFSISAEEKLKVNLATDTCLITSYSYKGLSEDDYAKIQAFRRRLVRPKVLGYHYPTLCVKIKRELEKQHGIDFKCDKCAQQEQMADRNHSSPSTSSMEDPTTQQQSEPLDKRKAIMEQVEEESRTPALRM